MHIVKPNLALPKTRRQRIICVGLCLVLFLGLIKGYQTFSQKKNPRQQRQNIAVHVQAVQNEDLIKTISLVGQTVPKAQVDIAAKYQGKVIKVYAELGQQVKAGDLLVEEDTTDASLNIDQNTHAFQEAMANIQTTESQITANFNKTKADYDKALNTYERYKQVYDAGGISKETLESAHQQMQDAKANHEAIANQMQDGVASSITAAYESAAKAQSTLALSHKQKSDLLLTSSIDGIVGYRKVEAGDTVSAGTKLLSVFDNSQIYVDYQVPEQDLAAFKKGMPITIHIASISKDLTGNIIYISPQIDTSSFNYTLRVVLDNKEGLLKSGMFAKALVKDVLRSQVIAVPKAAVINKDGKQLVFVLNPADNTVALKEVKTGITGDENIEILNGLGVGEQIATTNLARLYAGATVTPLAPGTAAE